MTIGLRGLVPWTVLSVPALACAVEAADEPAVTREFEIRNGRAYLGGHEVDLWGLRCGNALHSEAIAERHIRNLDNMAVHGINLIGVYIQGSNSRARAHSGEVGRSCRGCSSKVTEVRPAIRPAGSEESVQSPRFWRWLAGSNRWTRC